MTQRDVDLAIGLIRSTLECGEQDALSWLLACVLPGHDLGTVAWSIIMEHDLDLDLN